jgi:hypothetical protein
VILNVPANCYLNLHFHCFIVVSLTATLSQMIALPMQAIVSLYYMSLYNLTLYQLRLLDRFPERLRCIGNLLAPNPVDSMPTPQLKAQGPLFLGQ